MADDDVLGVGRAARGSKRRMLSIGGEPWRATSADVVRAAGLRDGERIGRAELELQLAEVEPRSARERALRLLSARERTGAELLRRLEEDGYPETVAGDVVSALSATGLVDDARFAAAMARSLIEIRGLGRSRALRELVRRGLPEVLAREAVGELVSVEGECERALAAARRMVRSSDTVQRLASRLVRRGFAPSDALSAARMVVPGPEDEDAGIEP